MCQGKWGTLFSIKCDIWVMFAKLDNILNSGYSIIHSFLPFNSKCCAASTTVTCVLSRILSCSFSHCVLRLVFRPGETEAGLLLHRHLLSQQYLRVGVLLLPARVTVYSLHLLPARRSGKQKLSFKLPLQEKKNRKR